jgi:ribose 5-phosphate isomerase B
MVIYIGADHQGFELKSHLVAFLRSAGYAAVDMTEMYQEGDDYPDVATVVAEKVSVDVNARGILVCGSGAGVAVMANKFSNVRAATVATADQAFDVRNDDNINVLCLGARYTNAATAEKITSVWLQTPFISEERFERRLRKIEERERIIFQNDTQKDGKLSWK